MLSFGATGRPAVHDRPEDSDEGCSAGLPIGQLAKGGRGHAGQAEERE